MAVMATILNLETATTNCSVSIARDGKTIALLEDNSPRYSHAEKLHLFIERCLQETKIELEDLDAVAVSKGPGSYTGLRIGVSAAKGLCYSLDIPLISIDTLASMAHSVQADEGYIIPLLDARRMEVYAAVFDHEYKEIRPTWAEIVNENSFAEFLKDKPLYLIGSGAEKCKEVLMDDQIIFDPSVLPSAGIMSNLSFDQFEKGQFENTAYFEPFYLKDFIVTQPKRQG